MGVQHGGLDGVQFAGGQCTFPNHGVERAGAFHHKRRDAVGVVGLEHARVDAAKAGKLCQDLAFFKGGGGRHIRIGVQLRQQPDGLQVIA